MAATCLLGVGTEATTMPLFACQVTEGGEVGRWWGGGREEARRREKEGEKGGSGGKERVEQNWDLIVRIGDFIS